MKEYKNRLEVPEKYKVNLTDMYKNTQEWYQEYNQILNEYPKVEKYKGKLGNATDLYDFLCEATLIDSRITDLYIYAQVSHDTELANEEFSIMKNKILQLNSEFNQISAFFAPEILRLSKEKFQNLFKENPKLNDFQVYLEEIYSEKDHILSEQEEEMIALLTETFQSYEDISSSLINSEHDYGTIRLKNGEIKKIAANNISFLRSNSSRTVRKNAQRKFGQKLKQYEDTASDLLYNYIKNNIHLAKIHKYNSPWEEKLLTIHISNEVFENMKTSAKKNAFALQNYYRLIKKILNVRTLHKYDIRVPWNKEEKAYTIEEAQKLIKEALKVLGNDYIEKIDKVFENHYIDYCQYKGKVNGGYSISGYKYPSRIMLSFNGTFDDVLTIAHEVGHSIHHEYICAKNLLWYRETSTFVAEVASLTNEFLVNQFLLSSKRKEQRLLGIENILKTFENNFFGAVIEGEIEQKMYDYVMDGNVLTADYLNALVLENFQDYEQKSVVNDNYAELSWITRSHYYSDFYLYSYALCVAVAIVLANRIIHKEENIVNKYKEFLSSGSNLQPKEIYQKLGINIEDPAIFDEAIKYFNNYIQEYNLIMEEGESNE